MGRCFTEPRLPFPSIRVPTRCFGPLLPTAVAECELSIALTSFGQFLDRPVVCVLFGQGSMPSESQTYAHVAVASGDLHMSKADGAAWKNQEKANKHRCSMDK